VSKYSEQDLAYLAGYLDGEGCLWASCTNDGKSCRVGITVANTHRPTIEWLQKTFGGKIGKSRAPRKINHRTCHVWVINSQEAIELCSWVVPYLREKAEQGIVLMMIQALFKYPKQHIKHNPIPDYIKQERLRLVNYIKGLKHIEW
jgi:hypothetical protein